MNDIAKNDYSKKPSFESDVLYKNLVELIPDIIYQSDREGNQTFMNDAAYRLLEASKEDVIGQPWLKWIHPDDRERSCNIFMKMIKQGADVFDFENRYVSKSGKIIHVLHNVSIMRNEKGDIMGTQGTARNITERKWIEGKLLEREILYRSLSENLPAIVYRLHLGENHRMQFFNNMLSEITGYTDDELICGRICCIESLIIPEDRDKVVDTVKYSIMENKAFEVEYGLLHKKGEIKKLLELGRPMPGPDGKPCCIDGVIFDITERKKAEEELIRHRENLALIVEEKTCELTSAIELLQNEIFERRSAEEALRESERRYRELVNYMSSGVAVYEAVEGGNNFIFKDFNSAGERIDKIKKENIIGEKLTDAFPGIREMGLFDVFKRVWETGKAERHSVSLYKDHRISGWRENYVYKLPSGEIVAIYNDITEQVLSAERESALFIELKTIFEHFPVGIVYLDHNFKIISSNKFFNDFTGLEEGVLAGKICYEAVGEYADDPDKKGAEKICSFCKKDICFKTGKTTVIERPLGDKFVRVTTVPEFNESSDICKFMEIVEDITDRKRAEAEAVRASHLAALGELAAGVAHEINNPINGIINYTQILLNNSIRGSKEYDIAGRIIKEGDRIAGIVKNLLSFARNSSEDKIPTSIADILSEALSLARTQLIKDGIELIVDFPAALPVVFTRPQQIEQVFLNVISNARYALNTKYEGTHKEKILEISAGKVTIQTRPYIHIVFHDRGTGIRSDIMDKIINPFFSTKPKGIGTGLGLSISHGIMSNHGGRLLIDSIEGKFTKVTVELPATIDDRRIF